MKPGNQVHTHPVTSCNSASYDIAGMESVWNQSIR